MDEFFGEFVRDLMPWLDEVAGRPCVFRNKHGAFHATIMDVSSRGILYSANGKLSSLEYEKIVTFSGHKLLMGTTEENVYEVVYDASMSL